MNAQRLLQHFNRIAEAPDAVARLRRFLLDLAVRGKLVEQDPKDEPAPELLKQIQIEKVRSVKDGEIRKQYLPPIEANEVPFEVPGSWTLVRLGQALELVNGRAFKPTEWDKFGLPIIRIQNLNNADASFNFCATPVPEKFHVKRGDFLISWSGTPGTSFGAHIWDRGHAILNQHIFRAELIGDIFLPPFLKLAINSRLLELIDQAHGGAGLQHITKPKLERLPLTLPPLAEQHRIVAKVDELTVLCDRLEAAQAERERRRDRLAVSSLHRLNNGANAESFREYARFHVHHLPRLTTRPEHIQQLRQSILNLAVRGKLVSQSANDEPVATQFALSDRARRTTAKEDHRADGNLQTLLAAEDRWNVPSSWKWRSLADVVLFIDYRGQTPGKVEQGVRLITAKNVKKGLINLSPEEFLSEATYRTWMTRGFPKEGDILFTTEAPMGNAAVVRLHEPFALAQRVICFRPYGAVNSDFLVLQLLAEPFQSILNKTATGLTAKGIKAAKLKRLPVVVPPLAEQHRIVAKVHELMALSDEVERGLLTTAAIRHQLFEAAVHEALAGRRDRQERVS